MFKRICIPVIDNDTSQHVLQWGFEFARKLGATVIVTHTGHAKHLALEASPIPGANPLESWARLGAQLEVVTVTRSVRGPDIAEAICAVAREEHADLIFVPTHAREGVNRLLLGSVAERVTRLSMIPVMLVRFSTPAEGLNFTRIVVPVDGSSTAQLALSCARDLAAQLEAKLTLLHVIEDLPTPYYAMDGALSATTIDEWQRGMEQAGRYITARAADTCAPNTAETRVEHGGDGVARTINRVTEEIGGDLIVIGTHGRGGMERLLLGSVAESVAHHANVPVLLVSPKQRAEQWQPSVLETLAQEVAEERAKRAQGRTNT
jgi:nucleotide-binding universal stress UspA family protein